MAIFIEFDCGIDSHMHEAKSHAMFRAEHRQEVHLALWLVTWLLYSCTKVFFFTWPSPRAAQVLKYRRFILFYFIFIFIYYYYYFFFLGGGGPNGDWLDLFTWPFRDVLGRLTWSTAQCHHRREQNVYVCAFIASLACYCNFEPPYDIRTYTRMRGIMANISGAVLVEMILAPMYIRRPSILA